LSREFLFRQTDQLDLSERHQFLELFGRVFPRMMSLAGFERKYLCTPLGYSHHGLMFVKGRLAGAYNLIPYSYRYFGELRLFGLSVDAMVAPEYRGGPFNLLTMAQLACEGAMRDGIGFVFGFPNAQAYQFTTRVLQWRNIGELGYHALPINIGVFRPRWRWANPGMHVGARCLAHLPPLCRHARRDFNIEKLPDECFERHRYDGEYQKINLSDGRCTYRTCVERDQIHVTYIVDVVPLTRVSLAQAVRAVYEDVRSRTDMLLYVGRLPFCPSGLLRVPSSMQPRRVSMCGRVLNKRLIDERVLDISNWNVNISNFDTR
jgi:hypothetical protein